MGHHTAKPQMSKTLIESIHIPLTPSDGRAHQRRSFAQQNYMSEKWPYSWIRNIKSSTFIEQRKKQDTLPAKTFKVAVSNNEERQKDGWNCGIFTLEFLTKDIGEPDRDHESLLPPLKVQIQIQNFLFGLNGPCKQCHLDELVGVSSASSQ
ncbi:hypothetical protein CAPTEDRAFT_214152 [Capitella teleta]|uniref:Uncharacterized protein n=1 Tax=Capitella teleta TaxID=283909 RepID=R7TKE6_CAPTE|nr:hypothetical protein CAPTEDRAFT_214152 [Capitella teleta]|eukprot:ELT94179.1 hypothetical protein CAPTEDRAFT_214152 [Capitella teleta]